MRVFSLLIRLGTAGSVGIIAFLLIMWTVGSGLGLVVLALVGVGNVGKLSAYLFVTLPAVVTSVLVMYTVAWMLGVDLRTRLMSIIVLVGGEAVLLMNVFGSLELLLNVFG